MFTSMVFVVDGSKGAISGSMKSDMVAAERYPPLPFCQITLVLVKTQLRDTICKFVLQIDDNIRCSNF